MGGAQAVAAFAYGVEDGVDVCDPVSLVTGPGNIYVAAAKRLLKGVIGIDAEAGPTEIAVLADDTADAEHVASDLVSQAEHDPLAAAVLVTDSRGARRRRRGGARPPGRGDEAHRAGRHGARRCAVRHRARRRPRRRARPRQRLRRRAPRDPDPRRGSGRGAGAQRRRGLRRRRGRRSASATTPRAPTTCCPRVGARATAAACRCSRSCAASTSSPTRRPRCARWAVTSSRWRGRGPPGARRGRARPAPRRRPAGLNPALVRPHLDPWTPARFEAMLRPDLRGAARPTARPSSTCRSRSTPTRTRMPSLRRRRGDHRGGGRHGGRPEPLPRPGVHRAARGARGVPPLAERHRRGARPGLGRATARTRCCCTSSRRSAEWGAPRSASRRRTRCTRSSRRRRARRGSTGCAGAEGGAFDLDAASAVQQVRGHRPARGLPVLARTTPPARPCPSTSSRRCTTPPTPSLVVVDEAYAEFARPGTPSALTLLEGRPRLVVTRTMSKAFALAGGGSGYLAADPALVDALRLVRMPYHLSTRRRRSRSPRWPTPTSCSRRWWPSRTSATGSSPSCTPGLPPVPSDANFVLFGGLADARATWSALLDRGSSSATWASAPSSCHGRHAGRDHPVPEADGRPRPDSTGSTSTRRSEGMTAHRRPAWPGHVREHGRGDRRPRRHRPSPRSAPASGSTTTCCCPSRSTRSSTSPCRPTATSMSTRTTPSRTSRSSSARPCARPSATRAASPGSATRPCRSTRRSSRRSSTSPGRPYCVHDGRAGGPGVRRHRWRVCRVR